MWFEKITLVAHGALWCLPSKRRESQQISAKNRSETMFYYIVPLKNLIYGRIKFCRYMSLDVEKMKEKFYEIYFDP